MAERNMWGCKNGHFYVMESDKNTNGLLCECDLELSYIPGTRVENNSLKDLTLPVKDLPPCTEVNCIPLYEKKYNEEYRYNVCTTPDHEEFSGLRGEAGPSSRRNITNQSKLYSRTNNVYYEGCEDNEDSEIILANELLKRTDRSEIYFRRGRGRGGPSRSYPVLPFAIIRPLG